MSRWVVLLLVAFALAFALTGFFYIHELLPAWLRAPSSLLLSAVAIASGLDYLLGIGDVYNTPWLVFGANLVASVALVGLVASAGRLKRGR